MARYIRHEYCRSPDGVLVKKTTVTTVEDASPLALAVEQKASENPGCVVMGVGLNDNVDYVGVIPELSGKGDEPMDQRSDDLAFGDLFGYIRDLVNDYRNGDWLNFIRHAAQALADVLGQIPQGVQAQLDVSPSTLRDDQLIGAIEANAAACDPRTQELTLPGGGMVAAVLKELLKEALKRWLDKI